MPSPSMQQPPLPTIPRASLRQGQERPETVGSSKTDLHRSVLEMQASQGKVYQEKMRTRFMSVSERSPGGRDRERTYSLGSMDSGRASSTQSDLACNFLPKLSEPKENIVAKLALSQKALEKSGVGLVVARGAGLSYRGTGARKVLDGLNMTIARGEIYGLLGASGCGKTSLLSVLLGRRELDSGLVQVMGSQPRPGKHIGYMPQELALYTEFTIRETFLYFGRIYGMSVKEVHTQLGFLTDLLQLPEESRRVGTLSGGQQRRVSFSMALLHNPGLLILDEPTVGVDPLLRQNIWRHLRQLASQPGQEKTILVTTHYIEEAAQADRVGMMRQGRLLAEEQPKALMSRYATSNLEEVFLRLCVRDVKTDKMTLEDYEPPQMKDPVVGALEKILDKGDSESGHDVEEESSSSKSCLPKSSNLHALLIKNLLKLKRNPAMLLFAFMLPAIQVIFFCIAIGQDPKGLNLGVVNLETNSSSCDKDLCQSFDGLSCHLFDGSSETVVAQDFQSESEALASAASGSIWGYVVIPANFSSTLFDEVPAAQGGLEVRLDSSNHQVYISLLHWLTESYSNFSQSVSQCQAPGSLSLLGGKSTGSFSLGPPIYGEREPSFSHFMAPGIIVLVIYFLAVALTGESFITERASGLLERSWIAGVKPSEILASHILVQFVVMLVQTLVTLTTILWAFSVPCHGPLGWLVVLTLLQGLAGMSFGFLVSSLCDSQAVAMQLSIGSFYPNLLLSGILWPLEGMPLALQWVALLLPNTLATQAMRNVMLRGWGISQPGVYLGLLSSSAWIFLYLLLSWATVRLKK